MHLVLEYCAEGSLRSYLDKNIIERALTYGGDTKHQQKTAACPFWGIQLPEHEIGNFLCQLLAGLAYHHSRGVVHEDLKVS